MRGQARRAVQAGCGSLTRVDMALNQHLEGRGTGQIPMSSTSFPGTVPSPGDAEVSKQTHHSEGLGVRGHKGMPSSGGGLDKPLSLSGPSFPVFTVLEGMLVS